MKPPGFAVLVAVGLAFVARAEEAGYRPAVKAELLTLTTQTVAGQPIVYPRTDAPEVRILRVTIPPGAETGWHQHPFPGYAYMLSGEITIDMEGGKSHVLRAGDALVESVGLAHNGRNLGSEPAVLVMIVTGEKGRPITVPSAPR